MTPRILAPSAAISVDQDANVSLLETQARMTRYTPSCSTALSVNTHMAFHHSSTERSQKLTVRSQARCPRMRLSPTGLVPSRINCSQHQTFCLLRFAAVREPISFLHARVPRRERCVIGTLVILLAITQLLQLCSLRSRQLQCSTRWRSWRSHQQFVHKALSSRRLVSTSFLFSYYDWQYRFSFIRRENSCL